MEGKYSFQSPIYCPNCNNFSQGKPTLMAQSSQPIVSLQQSPLQPSEGQQTEQAVPLQPQQGESQPTQQVTPPQQPTVQPVGEEAIPGVIEEQPVVEQDNLEIILPPVPPGEAFFENILRLNIGRPVRVHANITAPGANEFTGILAAAGTDFIIVSDTETGDVHTILTVLVEYVTFMEAISLDTEGLEEELVSTEG